MVNNIFGQILKLAEKENKVENTREDLESIVKELKRNKACDKQGWCNEMIIHGGESIKKSIHLALSEINGNEIVPNEWEELIIKSIHKKGSRHELGNRRGLFITSIMSKLNEKMILKKMRM